MIVVIMVLIVSFITFTTVTIICLYFYHTIVIVTITLIINQTWTEWELSFSFGLPRSIIGDDFTRATPHLNQIYSVLLFFYGSLMKPCQAIEVPMDKR